MTAPPPALPTITGMPRTWWGGWRRYLFAGIWLVYLLQTVDGVGHHARGVALVAGYAVVLLFAAAYLIALSAAWTARNRRFWFMYAGMLVLYTAEALFAHQDASVMLVYVTVLSVGRLGGRALPLVAGFAAVAAFLPAAIPAWHARVQWDALLTLPLIGLAMWSFFGIVRVNAELAAARAEVARLAAENERTRIARDLHDLLGHSLTTITVKAGLARRLAERGEPARSTAEIGEVERLSRRTLADVRAAVTGHRDITLAGELATAHEVLRAAGILVELPGSVDIVDPTLSELFGWVVREGVTNVVRHSRATRCTITVGPGWAEITDDGRGGPADVAAGTGLVGLRERAAALGGTVEARPLTPGWRLWVRVPAAAGEGRPDPASAPTIGT